jgi:NADP-dependent 3-hydroxy acid dehydrogenase YdfG
VLGESPVAQLQPDGVALDLDAFTPGLRFQGVGTSDRRAIRVLTEGLRMELHSQNIRCTIISPSAVATELPESSSEEETRKNLRELYKMAIPADSIARAIAYAIEQPAEVEIDEVVIRPIEQDF